MDNPSNRIPEPLSGEHGVVSEFGSMDGWTVSEAEAFLTTHVQLRRFHTTLEGYREYVFQDGSRLYIRPNGEIIRIPKPVYTADGRKIKGLRYNIYEGEIVRANIWHELPRSQQEWVVV